MTHVACPLVGRFGHEEAVQHYVRVLLLVMKKQDRTLIQEMKIHE